MGLSVEDHWIDGSADIIDCEETDDLKGAGFDVDLDLADLPTHSRTSFEAFRLQRRAASSRSPVAVHHDQPTRR
jgi:uncharacterized protein (DUF1330 family)